jgi:hypothetical protein
MVRVRVRVRVRVSICLSGIHPSSFSDSWHLEPYAQTQQAIAQNNINGAAAAKEEEDEGAAPTPLQPTKVQQLHGARL